MSHKRRQQRETAERESQALWAERLGAVVLGGAVALVVVTALIPSEAAISDGTYAPIVASWCVLLVLWAAASWLAPAPTLRLGWTEVALAALIGWHSLAALVSLGSVNGRQALNALWLFVGYGLTVFLFRQSVRTLAQARALFVAMIWLATLLASFGLYQYGYSMPRLRKQYEADPQHVLIENQVPIEPGSPQREQFENRLRSVEPLATFALTNSLAGVLAPWLVGIAAVALPLLRDRQRWQSLVALGFCAAILATCLVLTKSRTAYLATLAGLALVALYGRRGGWRLDWRIPTAIAGVLLVIGLAAIYWGGLDVQVLSEAPKSVLYRLEYWQATAAMIGDHLLWGCGPGNFQEAYTAYKLPQASETIKDPHNFLLEMWATAGTPGLALLMLVVVAFIVDVAAVSKSQPRQPDAAAPLPGGTALGANTLGIGAALGLLLAAPMATLVDYPLESLGGIPALWLLGIPLGAAGWWLLRPWITGGELTSAAVVVPQIVLLVNLLAAGALTFPGVLATLLVLMPVACLLAGQRASLPSAEPAAQPIAGNGTMPVLRLPRWGVALVSLGAATLTIACLATEYLPVLHSRLAVAQALYLLQSGEVQEAKARAADAARADTLTPEPWRLLTELRLSQWLATGDERDRQAFDDAADAHQKRDPRHHVAWYGRGTWYLTAWRKSAQHEDLEKALSAYTQASMRYPQRALYHAQLAWVLHLAGKDDLACQAAQKALELDEQMPHREQRLRRQKIIDPQISPAGATLPREETAEQTTLRLRTTFAEKMP